MKNIRLFKPSLDSKELNSIKKVFKKAWIGYGEEVQKFDFFAVGFVRVIDQVHQLLRAGPAMRVKNQIHRALFFHRYIQCAFPVLEHLRVLITD